MKARRQDKIIELISKNNIETQEELAKYLTEAGFDVTQATVSRDIRALHLEKIPNGKGGSKYYYPEAKIADNEKFLRVFKDGYSSIVPAGTIVVIKTISGMAMAVAAALDSINLSEIVGSIAGDDTIMCATRSIEDAEIVVDKIKQLIKSV